MLKPSRRRTPLILAATTLAAACVMLTMTSVRAQPWSSSPKDWSLTDTHVAQARRALMLMATQSEGDATRPPRVKGAWPGNVTSGRGFGTDRATANAAMGTPGAGPAGDTRPVVCVEGHGSFSTAATPRPPGAPAKTYAYAVTCFDPTTGEVLDTGFDDKPITAHFASTRSL